MARLKWLKQSRSSEGASARAKRAINVTRDLALVAAAAAAHPPLRA
jgi:hypothetical protein